MADLSMAIAGGGSAAATQKYCAIELKAVYQKYWLRGFLIAVGIHVLLLGAYFAPDLLGAWGSSRKKNRRR